MAINNDAHQAIASVEHWLTSFVIELNLCPFAKRELIEQRIRFAASDAKHELDLLQDIQDELVRLQQDGSISTTLLVVTDYLHKFEDYNQFLNLADVLLTELGMIGEFQIASFHPDYQFSGTQFDDPENFTNRAPYPVLHILREADVERAVASMDNPDDIPRRNIALMNQFGAAELAARLSSE